MTRWKLTIEYDGAPFIGWQRQDEGLSVQQVLEESIAKFTHQKDIKLHVCGRTDAGVHAVGQVAHVNVDNRWTAREMRDATNYHIGNLPVAVLAVERVPDSFHARFDARRRSYCYRITSGLRPAPQIDAGRSWHVKCDLDLDAMRAGAAFLKGKHDFSSFRAAQCQAKHPIRTVDLINIREERDPLRPGRQIYIDIMAKSFLHHQVRNIVGTLKAVGEGKWTPDDVQRILEARNRSCAGMTAPAHGLYFVRVEYDE